MLSHSENRLKKLLEAGADTATPWGAAIAQVLEMEGFPAFEDSFRLLVKSLREQAADSPETMEKILGFNILSPIWN